MAVSAKTFFGGGSIGAVENLLVPTGATQTKNGVTCTNNGNGTYTFNGTNERTDTAITFYLVSEFPLTNGTQYKLVGCPKGGSESTYQLLPYGWDSADYGSGLTFTGDGVKRSIIVKIGASYTCNNLIFKPMLTTNIKATYKEFVKRVGGFTNLVTNLVATYTQNGVTCTNNGDGTVTLNGTASTSFGMIIGTVKLTSGLKKYCGSPNFGGNSFMYMFDFTTATQTPYDYGDGAIFTATDDTYNISVWCPQGFTFSNAVFKPMVTESLLPEYYDFVKASGTRFARGTLTLSENTNKLEITHGLGVIPKAFVVYAVVSSYRNYTWNAFFDASYDTKAYVGMSTNVKQIQFNGDKSNLNYCYRDENTLAVPYYQSGYSWRAGTYEWIAVG